MDCGLIVTLPWFQRQPGEKSSWDLNPIADSLLYLCLATVDVSTWLRTCPQDLGQQLHGLSRQSTSGLMGRSSTLLARI